MKFEEVKQWVVIAGVAAGAYFAYQLYKQFKSGVSKVTCKPVTALANWYAALTSNGQVIPTGQILLPNGASVPVSALQVSPVAGTNSATFVYQGQTYYLNSPHDANGNWAASLSLQSCGLSPVTVTAPYATTPTQQTYYCAATGQCVSACTGI